MTDLNVDKKNNEKNQDSINLEERSVLVYEKTCL